MGTRGGRQPGAGRPKGSVSEETRKKLAITKYILEQVEKELAPMVSALIAKAKNGEVQAFKELLDRCLGKAKESVDITSVGERITGIQYIVPKEKTHEAVE